MHVEGTATVELPEYLKLLAEPELTEARLADDRDKRVLAAGSHPRGDLVFIMGDGRIMEIDLASLRCPSVEDVVPCQSGHGIRIVLKGDAFDPIEVESSWAEQAGHMLINLGTLVNVEGARISYVDS